jgi:hypothetical protein
MLLMQVGQAEEAVELLRHATSVLAEQVPGHPLLAQLRERFGQSRNKHPVDPSELANLALQARAGTSLDDTALQTLEQGLDTLAAAGPPLDTAAYLRAVANGSVLPPLPDDLPQPVAQFLASVRDAAQTIDDARP